MISPCIKKIFQLILIPISLIFSQCNKTPAPETFEPPRNTDPSRCTPVDVGEATDFVQQPNIADDRLVIVQGLSNPQSLVWRDSETGKTFYLARILGTERKLYFLKEVPDDAPPPGVSSQFQGHLLRWKHLPPKQRNHMAGGLKTQYNIDVDPDAAFLIIEGQKPSGC